MNDNSVINYQLPEYDMYAAMILSAYLDKENSLIEENTPKTPSSSPSSSSINTDESEKKEDDIIDLDNNLIWVPADKHPQIAPIEFAKFIKTHKNTTPTRRAKSLSRKKSILSQSHTSDDSDDELERTLSEKKRVFLNKLMNDNQGLKDNLVFDRNSTTLDNSRIIAPIQERALSRRSAFSARGRSKKKMADRPKEPKKKTEEWNKSEGIILYDRPVNMSELIDLGTTPLESDNSQLGILSRVHDAESQMRTQLVVAEEDVKEVVKEEDGKKLKRKPSWFNALFQDKKKNSKKMNDIPFLRQSTDTHSALSGIASLFTRSLSLRSTPPIDIPPPTLHHDIILFNTNRLPLHVERAIYRLSHMKLADPRRPLYQQVLISNLMFWYLSIQQTDIPEQRVETASLPEQDNKKRGKMSRFIQSAKKRVHTQHYDEEDDIPLSHYRS